MTEATPGITGFAGAFVHGSANWLADDADLPPTSDLDVLVVLDGPEPAAKPGTFHYHGVTLEVSYLSCDELRSPDQVLGRYDLAGGFHVPSVILDPSGRLTVLQQAVARDYAKRAWVVRRCEDARRRVVRNLDAIRETDPLHDQVTSWLFGTGVTTHNILLVAGLRNPTIRRRYLASRDLLADYGYAEVQEMLLTLLGCESMDQGRVAHHLDAVTAAFDAAKQVVKTPFFFAADISEAARPVAIDGSRELIVHGAHREAVFWIAATYARCLKVLHHDAPSARCHLHDDGFRRLTADLGITLYPDLLRRCGDVRTALPQLWTVAESIIAANREIDASGNSQTD